MSSQPSCPSPSESTISLVSRNTEGPASSTTALIPKGKSREQESTSDGSTTNVTNTSSAASAPARKQKDYEAAFAALSSSMGFAGHSPTPMHSKKTTKTESQKQTKRTGNPTSRTTQEPSASSSNK